MLSQDGGKEVILFRMDALEPLWGKAASKGILKYIGGSEDPLPDKYQKRFLDALAQQNYLVTIDEKTHLPVSYDADLTELVRTTVLIQKEAEEAKRGKKLSTTQQAMATAFLDSLSLKFHMDLAPEEGKTIVIPKDVRNAREENKAEASAGDDLRVSDKRSRTAPSSHSFSPAWPYGTGTGHRGRISRVYGSRRCRPGI